MATDNLSDNDKDFLSKCEEELKDRYTEKDEDFMKVFNASASDPPIIENWWVPQNHSRGNDRRSNIRFSSYDRSNNRHRRYQNRGYPDTGYEDQGHQNRGHQSRDYRGREDYYSKRRLH